MNFSRLYSTQSAGALGLLMASFLLAACSSGGGDESASSSSSAASSGGGGEGEGGAGGGAGGAGGGAGGAGGGTGGSEAIWAWCPKAEDYVGDPSWSATVEVTEDALYCAVFDESKTFEETLATKAQLRFIPGTYKVPAAAATGPFSLPHCLRFVEDGKQPTQKGAGELKAEFPEFMGEVSYNFQYAQPMEAAGVGWFSEVRFNGPWEPSSPKPISVAGKFTDASATHAVDYYLCQGADCANASDRRFFNSCTAEGAATEHTHTITFQGGDIKLVLRIGGSFASTEPGAFVSGSGKLDGTAFTQTSYWKLVYVPEHHHFTRHFVVLFDQPIGSACGLKVEHVLSDTLDAAVNLVDCSLKNLEARTVLSEDNQKTP
jgi:hypothetical protein